MSSSSGCEGHTETSLIFGVDEGTAIPLTWNKSCASCSVTKRNRCLQKMEGFKCTYQIRKTHKPHKPHKSHKQHRRRVSTCTPNIGLSSDMIPDTSSAGIPMAVQNEGGHPGLVWPRYSRFEGSHDVERQSHDISKPTASAGDSPVEHTYGEPGEHGDVRVIGDRNKGGWREAMDHVAPSTWGNKPKPPSNERDNVMAFPARRTSYAQRIVPAAAAHDGDRGDGTTTMEIPLGGVEPFGQTGMVSADCGNSKCIRLRGSDVFDISSQRIYGVEGKEYSTIMTQPEFQEEGRSNGFYISTSGSRVVLGSPVDISPEDWRHVADAMLDPNIY